MFGKKKEEQETRAKNKRRRSAQNSMPWKEVYKNGVVLVAENTYIAICRFENAAYLSQPESEQQVIYERYVSMLNGLSPQLKYQEVIYNRPVRRERIRSLMVPNTATGDYCKAYADVQQSFLEEIAVDITEKEYLAVFSYKATSKLDNPFAALIKTVSMLAPKFQALGSSLTMLGGEEVLKVLYELYNPYSETVFEMPEGLISAKDLIAPGDIEYKAKKIELGEAVTRVYVAWSFGNTLDDTFITSLLQNNCRVTVSKHIEHVPKEQAIKSIQNRLKKLEADRQDRLKKNKQSGETYIPLELESNIKNCTQLISELSGNEDLYNVMVLVGVTARDDAELQEACTLITGKAAEHYVTLKALTLQQEEGLNSLMPYGLNQLKAQTSMLSKEVGVMTPFSYPTYLDEGGIYYGKNVRTGEPVIINRKLDKNSNGFIFGKSGGGKSFYAKLEISALLAMPWLADDDVIVVDPDGEFLSLAYENAEQSEVIRLASSSNTVINPFALSDYELEAYGDDAINNQSHYILAFISALKGAELTAIEKTIADRAVTRCYNIYVEDGKKTMPTLGSFDSELAAMDEPEAHTLRLYIERYITGSIKLFSGQTNVSFKKKLTVFDLTQLGSELKDTGMLALLSAIWNKVFDNHLKGKYTWIYLDELHRYYRQEDGLAAHQIERLYAEIRKYGGIVTAMTQHPSGVLASPTASSMLANSQFVVLFEQDDANVEAMTERLKLNSDQRRLLIACNTGEAVLRAKNSTIAIQLKYPRDNKVYDTITTDFKDRIATQGS